MGGHGRGPGGAVGAGLGWRLMQAMIEVAGWMGLQVIEGQVLRENSTMLAMCRQLGFRVVPDPEDATVMLVTLPVAGAGAVWGGRVRPGRPVRSRSSPGVEA